MLLSVVDDETILSSVSTPPKPLFILPFSIFYLNSFSLFSQIYELRFIIFIYGFFCLCSFLSHFQHFSMSHANFFAQAHQTLSRILSVVVVAVVSLHPKQRSPRTSKTIRRLSRKSLSHPPTTRSLDIGNLSTFFHSRSMFRRYFFSVF